MIAENRFRFCPSFSSDELSPPFVLAQCGTRQFFCHCRHTLDTCFRDLASFTMSVRVWHSPLRQPYAVASPASTSLTWPDRTVPDCVHLSCCALIVSPSAAAPRLCPLVIIHTQYKVQRSCVTSLVLPPKHPTSVTHMHTTKIQIQGYRNSNVLYFRACGWLTRGMLSRVAKGEN